MKTILLIDGNTLQWRAAYAFGESKVANGVLGYLCKIIDKTNPEKVLIFWDISKSRWRKDVFPEYKAKRAESKKDLDVETIYSQVKLAKRLINMLGIRQVEVNGVEADDLIAWFAQYFYSTLRDYRIVVTTVDKDLWQLVNDRVIVLDFKSGDFINHLYVTHEMGIQPSLVPHLKALSGDTSDNIPGVKGIGEKTALQMLGKFGSLQGMLSNEAFKELAKKKATAKILDSFPDVLVYCRITQLPLLSEMWVILNDDEKRDLSTAITTVVSKDSAGVHILRDFIDSGIKLPQGDYTFQPHELAKFGEYLNRSVVEKSASLVDLDVKVKGCRRCTLRECCGSYGPTLAAGGTGAEVMLLGGNPGESDWLSGVPFSGESAAFMERFFGSTGIDRGECWVTNVCKCYSEGRPISQGEILSCLGNFREELELVNPKLIIAFGDDAMSVVTPYGSNLSKYVGEVFPNSVGLVGKVDSRVAILPHPTYAIRSKKLLAEFEYGCEKIKEFLEAL
jgi:uracil-DNA glycosylase family 4